MMQQRQRRLDCSERYANDILWMSVWRIILTVWDLKRLSGGFPISSNVTWSKRIRRKIPRNHDDDVFRTTHRGKRFFAPLLAARVQYDAMPLLDEQLGAHLAESIRRTCNKKPRHDRLLSVLLPMHAGQVKMQGRRCHAPGRVDSVLSLFQLSRGI
jgi:hypothetical protein